MPYFWVSVDCRRDWAVYRGNYLFLKRRRIKNENTKNIIAK
jgi:hypothetical protein